MTLTALLNQHEKDKSAQRSSQLHLVPVNRGHLGPTFTSFPNAWKLFHVPTLGWFQRLWRPEDLWAEFHLSQTTCYISKPLLAFGQIKDEAKAES